jgi:CBS domain-containing protein
MPSPGTHFAICIVTMIKAETIDFLKNVDPFNLLPEEELEGIVEDVSLEYFPKGVHILTQDGSPSEYLYIIKRGGVRVYMTSETDDEINIDYRGEGEHFGLLSLVSGDRSRYNIIAYEDTISFLIPKEKLLNILQRNPSVNEYFLKSFFINFIDKTREETQKRYSGLAGGDRVLFTTPVGEVVRREPITAAESLSIQDAARKMALNKISSLIIVNDTDIPVGIVTDRDLREKVVAKGLDLSYPVRMIMSSPLIKVDAEEYCFEALLKMMRYNIHHILVVESGKFRGILTNHDFMVLQGSSPMVLVKELEDIQMLKSVGETMPKIHKTVATLLREGAKAHNVTGIITELTEKIVNRIVDLSEKESGPAPVGYSLFLFDEGGRRELTLNRSLKMGIVYEDTGSSRLIKETEDFFSRLAKTMEETLSSGGIASGEESLAVDNIMSFSDWKEKFDRWAAFPGRHNPRAEYADMRVVRGDGEPVKKLRGRLIESLASRDTMMDVAILEALKNSPPLGFFRRFVVEKSGEHRSELDLYEKGVRPLVDAIRVFALQRRVENYSTWRRVVELRSRYSFAHTEDIEHALEYLLTLLIHHQLKQLEQGRVPDNFINPEHLANIEKKTLKETFQLIATLYDLLEKSLSPEVVET